MTTKRTHGPCTCDVAAEAARLAPLGLRVGHSADCPSLYPAQQEPDALTKLARLARDLAEDDCEAILALISEAREEQKQAAVRAKNEGLEKIAVWAERRPLGCRDRRCKACVEAVVIAGQARVFKDPEP